MSVVDGEPILAYNLKLGAKNRDAKKSGKSSKEEASDRPMIIKHIYKLPPPNEGGKPRYRFGGVDAKYEDHVMSKFCKEDLALKASKELGLPIEKATPKPEKEGASKTKEKTLIKKPVAKKAVAKTKAAPVKKTPVKSQKDSDLSSKGDKFKETPKTKEDSRKNSKKSKKEPSSDEENVSDSETSESES